MKRLIVIGLFVTAAAIAGSAPANASVIVVAPNSLTECPVVGAATSCAVLYRFNGDGSIDTLLDPTISSTDGIEDTLAGVLNNSGHSIDSLTLSGVGVNSIGIFAFDGDGQSPVPNPGVGPGATYFGHYDTAAGPGAGTTFFTGINGDGTLGTVNFPGLIDGGSGWWVLEDQISFTAPPPVGVPEPATLTLFGLGLVGARLRGRRKA